MSVVETGTRAIASYVPRRLGDAMATIDRGGDHLCDRSIARAREHSRTHTTMQCGNDDDVIRSYTCVAAATSDRPPPQSTGYRSISDRRHYTRAAKCERAHNPRSNKFIILSTNRGRQCKRCVCVRVCVLWICQAVDYLRCVWRRRPCNCRDRGGWPTAKWLFGVPSRARVSAC